MADLIATVHQEKLTDSWAVVVTTADHQRMLGRWYRFESEGHALIAWSDRLSKQFPEGTKLLVQR